ncbi:MAG: NUDIX hydrolase [Bacteroidetes bacterium]|nr:MAG: NUDIX hydrolase [Bacteroidota bacterium]
MIFYLWKNKIYIHPMELKDLRSISIWKKEKLELNISVDCVLLTVRDKKLKVLLNMPFPEVGYFLPGGFIMTDEDADAAAIRILHQRTGLDHIYLKQFRAFSDPGRFSYPTLFRNIGWEKHLMEELHTLSERMISIGYFALVNAELIQPTGGDFQESTTWGDIEHLPELNFDHELIITEAVDALRRELYFRPVLYNLLPEKFTMPELQNLYEIILGKPLDRGSFQRKMLRWDVFERLEERRSGVAHKRPFLYRFNKEKYTTALQKGIHFAI